VAVTPVQVFDAVKEIFEVLQVARVVNPLILHGSHGPGHISGVLEYPYIGRKATKPSRFKAKKAAKRFKNTQIILELKLCIYLTMMMGLTILSLPIITTAK